VIAGVLLNECTWTGLAKMSSRMSHLGVLAKWTCKYTWSLVSGVMSRTRSQITIVVWCYLATANFFLVT
jgi:hypothetical protein